MRRKEGIVIEVLKGIASAVGFLCIFCAGFIALAMVASYFTDDGEDDVDNY